MNAENKYTTRVVKSQGLLYIFEILKNEGLIRKEDILSELNINDLSFWRYIQEIKAFIYNFNLPYELKYDRKSAVYRLIDTNL
ncbi:MAG: hypothetical protein K5906_00820 [Bacilli bacterium]|nr:hypothetical protein [Bacilli bacterium]